MFRFLVYDRCPNALSDALGNEFFIAKFETLEEMEGFREMVFEKN